MKENVYFNKKLSLMYCENISTCDKQYDEAIKRDEEKLPREALPLSPCGGQGGEKSLFVPPPSLGTHLQRHGRLKSQDGATRKLHQSSGIPALF
jgi:hypothetical protein